MKRNEGLLSFGADPVITTWYRSQGKAAAVCTGEYTWSAHHTCRYICTSPGLQTHIAPHYSTWGARVTRKDSKELDQKERPLWELEGNGKNKHKPAQGVFIILLWAKPRG